MKIPKIIHYVWVGGTPIPKKIKKMIEHNKKVLGPKWKTKIWTEKDFDINSNPFTKYWYAKKEWAFVSDYIRVFAVKKFGGWYVDTDIYLSKSLDEISTSEYVASRTYFVEHTASIFGGTKNNKISNTYLKTMEHERLIKKPPRIMSTHIHTYAIRSHFDIPDNNSNYITKDISIYTEDVMQVKIGDNNVAIHEHHANWKGGGDLKVSKYYNKKIDAFTHYDERALNIYVKRRDKIHRKIKRLLKR